MVYTIPMKLASMVVVTLGLVGTAHAQETPPKPKPLPTVAITISPIHLIFPVVELTVELRAHDKVGVAAIIGAGQVTPEDGGEPVGVFELGAQGRYYVLGARRHRVNLGLEVLYIRADAAQGGVTATGDGFSIGPFAGYKYTADIGFTFDAQLGVARTGYGARASTGETQSDAKTSPLLNLNVGWSF